MQMRIARPGADATGCADHLSTLDVLPASNGARVQVDIHRRIAAAVIYDHDAGRAARIGDTSGRGGCHGRAAGRTADPHQVEGIFVVAVGPAIVALDDFPGFAVAKWEGKHGSRGSDVGYGD